jgi:hypothetical protein
MPTARVSFLFPDVVISAPGSISTIHHLNAALMTDGKISDYTSK